MWRYQEDIPARTFRLYAAKLKKEPVPDGEQTLDEFRKTEAFDVIRERAMLVALQRRRVSIDVGLEMGMNKLLSSTKGEIELLHRMLGDHLADLQTLGLMPKSADELRLSGLPVDPETESGPAASSLAELLGAAPEAEAELARVLHMAAKQAG